MYEKQHLSVSELVAQKYTDQVLSKALMEAHEKDKSLNDAMKRIAVAAGKATPPNPIGV